MSFELVDADTILEHLGEFSYYQCFFLFLSCLMIFPNSFPNLIMYFGALDPNWKCVSNSTVCVLNGTQTKSNTLRCRIPRSEWEFTEEKGYSIVTEFDLVCDKSWLMYITTSIYFIGWIFGAFILGWLADKYGRRRVYYPVVFSLILSVSLTALSPNIYVFVFLRFVSGFLKGGSILLFVLISELVRGKYRPLAGITLWVVYGVAMCVMGLKAYFIRDWKLLFIVCSVPYIFILCFYKWTPESLRWQRLHGQTNKAMETLQKIASFNKKKFPENMQLKPELSDDIKPSYIELFNTKKMAIYSLTQGYSWIAFGMVYYGLSFAAADLGGNFYSNYILISAAEIPAAMFAIYFLSRFGRKKTIISSCIFASLCLFIIAVLVVTKKTRIARIVLAMMGKLFITIAFDSIYTWSLEIYPTYIRGQGLGYLQVMSRIGAASSPWVAKSLKDVHLSAPFVLMGTAGLFSGLLCLYLPETKGETTNETASDVNKGKNNINKSKNTYAMENIKSNATESLNGTKLKERY